MRIVNKYLNYQEHGFKLGQGFHAERVGPNANWSRRAFSNGELDTSELKNARTKTTIHFVSSFERFYQETEQKIAMALRMGFVGSDLDISHAMRISKNLERESHSLSLIVKSEKSFGSVEILDDAPAARLKNSAKSLLTKISQDELSADKFYNKYGDHYIDKEYRGVGFILMLSFGSFSEQLSDNFRSQSTLNYDGKVVEGNLSHSTYELLFDHVKKHSFSYEFLSYGPNDQYKKSSTNSTSNEISINDIVSTKLIQATKLHEFKSGMLEIISNVHSYIDQFDKNHGVPYLYFASPMSEVLDIEDTNKYLATHDETILQTAILKIDTVNKEITRTNIAPNYKEYRKHLILYERALKKWLMSWIKKVENNDNDSKDLRTLIDEFEVDFRLKPNETDIYPGVEFSIPADGFARWKYPLGRQVKAPKWHKQWGCGGYVWVFHLPELDLSVSDQWELILNWGLIDFTIYNEKVKRKNYRNFKDIVGISNLNIGIALGNDLKQHERFRENDLLYLIDNGWSGKKVRFEISFDGEKEEEWFCHKEDNYNFRFMVIPKF